MSSGRRRPGMRGANDRLGLGESLFIGPGARFYKKEADAGRKLIELAKGEAFAAHEIDEHVVEAFEPDGAMLENEGNGVGS